MNGRKDDTTNNAAATPLLTSSSPVFASRQPVEEPSEQMLLDSQVIQEYLDENQCLIRAIVDNQHRGNLADAAKYQQRLQKNLLFLGLLVDVGNLRNAYSQAPFQAQPSPMSASAAPTPKSSQQK